MKLRSMHASGLLALITLLGWLPGSLHAQRGWGQGQGISWRPAQAPFGPNSGDGAIVGGPGNDPNPGSPMYLCRGMVQGSMIPGKWVRGNCNVAFGNAEQVLTSYQLAYGQAQWGPYRGNASSLLQTGRDANGGPLYSCRVRYVAGLLGTDYGYQPGKLAAGGSCQFPMGGKVVVQKDAFDVLYSARNHRPPFRYPPPYPTDQPQPYPPCRGTDIDVSYNRSTGHWEGPQCSPSDGFGNAQGPPKYPPVPGQN